MERIAAAFGIMEDSLMKTTTCLTLVLLILGALLYFPYPQAGFVLDGHYVIEHNALIKSPALWPQLFTHDFFHAYRSSWSSDFNYYRPVLSLSYALDYQLFGSNAAGYRWVNIFIHVANALLLFGLIQILFGYLRLAFLSAVFFFIHPVQEWVVAYVVGRGDLLQALFSLVSLLALALYLKGNKARWLALSAGGFLLALLTREVAVLLVFYAGLVGYVCTKDRKKAFAIAMIYAAGSLLYLGVRALTFPVGEKPIWQLINAGHFFAWLMTCAEYLLRFVVPYSLSYALPPAVHRWGLQLVLALALITGAAIYFRRQRDGRLRQAAGFAFSWLVVSFLSLFFVLKMIAHLGPYLSEHFLYFASAGFALIAAGFIAGLSRRWLRLTSFAALSLYFLGIGMANHIYWVNERVVLSRARLIDPNPYSVAAKQLAAAFEDDEAFVRELIARAPSLKRKSIWLARLGNIFHRRGEYAGAVATLKEAVSVNPDNLNAINELAICFLEQGKIQEGLEYLRMSLQKDDTYFDTHRIMGIALYRQGRFADAAAYLAKAQQYAPAHYEVSFYLTMASFFAKNEPLFQVSMETLLSQSTDQVRTLKEVSQELYHHGYFNEVVSLLEGADAVTQSDPHLRSLKHAAFKQMGR